MRHAVLAHGDLDLHTGVVDLAQHFLHAAHGLAVERGRFGQLDHHHLARLGRANSGLGDQHVLAVAPILGRHQPDAAFVQQAPDDRVRGTLHDLEHAPFGPAAPVLAHDAHLDTVAVQHRAHLVGGQINVRITIVAHHETVAVAVALHRAFNFIQQAAGKV